MSVHEPISIPHTVAAHATTAQPVKRARRRLGVSWPTIILFAVVISYVNGFWVTSLQITVGSLERSAPPFGRWLRDSTMMLPLYIAAILVAVLLARRWFGRSKRTLVRAAGTGVLIVAVCTLVGIGEVANSAAYDYQLQKEHVDLLDGFNHTQHEAASTVASTDACVGTCAAKQATLGLHVRAGTQASALMLITNLLVVAWLFAVGGDRLWKRARPNHTDGQQP